MNLSTPTNQIVAGLYFVIVGFLTFFSFFGVYILIRYGKSTPLTLGIAIVYSLFFLQILSQSFQTFQTLLV